MTGRVTVGVWWEDGKNRLPGSNEVLKPGWYWDDMEEHGGALTPMGPHGSDEAAQDNATKTFPGSTVLFEDRRPDYYSARQSAEEREEAEREFHPGDGVYVRQTAPDAVYRGFYGRFIEYTRPQGYVRVMLWNCWGMHQTTLLHPESLEAVGHGDVVGLEPRSRGVIQWDALGGDESGEPGPYEPGETPEQYGLDNLSEVELARLRAAGWTPEG